MATRKPKADAPTATYEVIDPLRLDSYDYAIGDPVELTPDQAAPLLGTVVKLAAEAA
jgi:hypothetical protein